MYDFKKGITQYVLINNEKGAHQGRYIAKVCGEAKGDTYTDKLEDAWTFPTWAYANLVRGRDEIKIGEVTTVNNEFVCKLI
jgi:hypothetical protein